MSRVFVIATILIISICNSYAMRCGTHLINEGDPVVRMLQLCGEPAQNNYSDIVYINKDGDGMNYFIHVNSAGIIDSINMSR